MMIKRSTIFFLALVLLSAPLHADERTAPLRLVLFQCAAGNTGLPAAHLRDIEAGLRRTLLLNGGFDVRGVLLSVSPEDAALLFEKVKAALGEGDAAGAVSAEEIGVTADAFQVLLASSVIVIPSVVDLRVEEDRRESGKVNYKAKLASVLTIITIGREPALSVRRVETMGYDPDRDRSVADAVRTITPMFAYELASLQETRPAVVILAFEKGEAVIDRGGKQGVLLGTEFIVRGTEPDEKGGEAFRERGLFIVSETTDDAAVGTAVYADPDVAAGDSVEEVRRFGLELSPFAVAFIPNGGTGDAAAYAGIRLTLAKGVYSLRPFLSIELAAYPFSTYLEWFPVRPFLGCELRFRFGRFELAALPMIGVEERFALSPSQTTTFMGFGLRGLVEISLLFGRDVKLAAAGGYEYWFGNRQGFLAGAVVAVKL